MEVPEEYVTECAYLNVKGAEDAVKKLEQLNLTTALMDAGQLQALSDDFQLTIEAMQEAESAVSGVPMPSKPAEETQQLYRSEQ